MSNSYIDNSKYKLYYKTFNGKVPFDNEYSDAAIGAFLLGWQVVPYQEIDEVPKGNYIMVVGEVTEIQNYLGREIPPINESWSSRFKNDEEVMLINDITFPCFIKPSGEIKTFSGCVVFNESDVKSLCYGYTGLVRRQELIDIVAEYRCYVSDMRIVGIKQYVGLPYQALNKGFVEEVLHESCKNLTEKSYALDFGIDSLGNTFLIEVNDAWAIGNYGLAPKDYFSFIRNRWFQLIK